MSKVFDAYAYYYDLLYKEKKYQQEVDFIHEILLSKGVNSGSILDMGCGTGIHAECLANLGFNVHGVDISPKMIESAKEKIKKGKAQLFFEEGDIRNKQINKTFDAIVSLFHVASYQVSNEDIIAMINNASKHLKDGGIFVFDFWYGPAVLREMPSVKIKKFENKEIKIHRIAEPIMFCNRNLVEVKYTVYVSDNKSQNEVLTEKHLMRYFFLPELEMILNSAGFKLLNSFEWLSNNPLSLSSWQGFIVAKKNDSKN